MSMGEIAHTQYRWIELIQVSDLAGQYGVCFAIFFVAACLARMLPCEVDVQPSSRPSAPVPIPFAFWPLLPAAAMFATLLGYGYWRTANVVTRPGPRVALIQGSIDMKFGGDEQEVRQKFYNEYFELSRQAVKKFGHVDLIVWPEIFYKSPLISFDTDAGDNDPTAKAEKLSGEEVRRWLRYRAAQTEHAFAETAEQLGSPLLVGLDTQHFTANGVKYFNSAAYVSKSGKLLGRYDKIHLVPFGEYIPCADLLPWLYKGLTPLSTGMTPGKGPVAMDLDFTVAPQEKKRICFAPNICYETVISRDICRQINTLKAQGRVPDLLINLSNDGWYWSSSELDMLLACSVFRAVECRKPYVIAANTGFSGSIDASGHVLEKGRRHDADILLAEVRLDRRRSFYLQYGDWPAGICLAGCIFFAVAGMWQRYRRRAARRRPQDRFHNRSRQVGQPRLASHRAPPYLGLPRSSNIFPHPCSANLPHFPYKGGILSFLPPIFPGLRPFG